MVKKYFWKIGIVTGFVMLGFVGTLYAVSTGAIQVGVAAAIKGEVKVTPPSAKVAHTLKNGDKIFMGDKIETGAEGQLQILLLDRTVFTLGPSSSITVDKFVFDPNHAGGKVGMAKGIRRAVSGKTANKRQESAAEIAALLNNLDEMDQKSQEAAQDRAKSSVASARR